MEYSSEKNQSKKQSESSQICQQPQLFGGCLIVNAQIVNTFLTHVFSARYARISRLAFWESVSMWDNISHKHKQHTTTCVMLLSSLMRTAARAQLCARVRPPTTRHIYLRTTDNDQRRAVHQPNPTAPRPSAAVRRRCPCRSTNRGRDVRHAAFGKAR